MRADAFRVEVPSRGFFFSLSQVPSASGPCLVRRVWTVTRLGAGPCQAVRLGCRRLVWCAGAPCKALRGATKPCKALRPGANTRRRRHRRPPRPHAPLSSSAPTSSQKLTPELQTRLEAPHMQSLSFRVCSGREASKQAGGRTGRNGPLQPTPIVLNKYTRNSCLPTCLGRY